MKNKNYTKKIISDYCVIDVETTGLSIYFDEIIEIALIKVRNDKIVEEYSQLIKPINTILRGEKSSKQIKAEKLKLGGQDIDIIDEYTFYDLLDEAR